MVNINQLISAPWIGEYEPSHEEYYGIDFQSRLPRFNQRMIPFMMRTPRINFGMRLIKGPILAASRFYIEDEQSKGDNHSPLKTFLINQISRFWRRDATKALRAVEWGYSGAEVMYKIHKNQICFDALRCVQPRDCRILTQHGQKVGMSVVRVPKRKSRVYLGGPKSFWHVHNREDHPWYGRSRLLGAYEPWVEMAMEGGSRDIRRLYYHKYAYSGETIYYPIKQIPTTTTAPGKGEQPSNKNIAQRIAEKRKTGGVTVFPNTYSDGQRDWEIVPSSPGPGGVEVGTYHSELKNEMLEGMGIPHEVVEAAETGSGYAGRRVPQTAFFSILQEIVNWLIFDFDEQILRPLVELNFGKQDYEIVPFGLITGTESENQSSAGSPAEIETEFTESQVRQVELSRQNASQIPYRLVV